LSNAHLFFDKSPTSLRICHQLLDNNLDSKTKVCNMKSLKAGDKKHSAYLHTIFLYAIQLFIYWNLEWSSKLSEV